jgi:hypothetical protein
MLQTPCSRPQPLPFWCAASFFDFLQQDTSKAAKGKRGNTKGKGGREPTIVIVFFHRTTIDGESFQKLNEIGKTFSSRCGVYLAISRKDKSIKQKTKAGEGEEKDKTFSAMWKKTKVFSKSSPLLNILLLVSRCLAAHSIALGIKVGD